MKSTSHKNRNRNTICNYSGNQFLHSQANKNNQNDPNLCQNQRGSIKLKLLELCSEKIFIHQQNYYQTMIQNQQQTNQLLQKVNEKARRQILQYYFNNHPLQQKQRKLRSRKSSQNLISSWTALQNLDMTYKEKQQNLLRQNGQLRKNIQIIQQKLKSLYANNGQHKKQQQTNSIKIIQNRINQHDQLIQKMKSKIIKKRKEKQQISTLFQKYLQSCQQKFGSQVVCAIKEIFCLIDQMQ